MGIAQRRFQTLFRSINVKFSRFYARLLVEHDLTLPQYSLLVVVNSEGTLPMHELSCRLLISRSAVSQIVDRLVRKKCLRRLEDAFDRRIKRIELTPAGVKLVKQIQGRTIRFLTKLIGNFSNREQAAIRRFYEQLSEALDRELG